MAMPFGKVPPPALLRKGLAENAPATESNCHTPCDCLSVIQKEPVASAAIPKKNAPLPSTVLECIGASCVPLACTLAMLFPALMAHMLPALSAAMPLQSQLLAAKPVVPDRFVPRVLPVPPPISNT